MNDELDFIDDPPPAKPVAMQVAIVKPQPAAPKAAASAASRPVGREKIAGRAPPHSAEAEQYLLACCLLDGSDTIARCLEAKLTGASFYNSANRLIYERICVIYQHEPPVELAVLAEELKDAGQLDAVGGYAYLTQISASIPTTAQAQYFIGKVRELHVLRELIKVATGAVEQAFNYQGEGMDELLAQTRVQLDSLATGPNGVHPRGLFDFTVPPAGHHSILLGNRYVNRGDGGVLSSTSGMGKSSMSIQMATLWALGRDAFGMRPNGAPTSLMVQAEDSDGDIGEVAASNAAALKLTDAERATVSAKVIIVTERVARGAMFVAKLRSLVAKHKPDLVWINPLQAFMSGDITESQDLGSFLREGLNSINEPPTFAYFVVHHTTKPPQEKKDRLWSEVMYDMAGGADLINWARFIISLRAEPDEGKFKLVFAKRGRRAGVTRKVPQGAGFREEIVTSIGLQHSQGTVTVNGHAIPLIFWEQCDLQPKSESGTTSSSNGGGRPREFTFGRFRDLFPADPVKALSAQILHRAAADSGISLRSFRYLIDDAVKDGFLVRLPSSHGVAKYHLSKL